MKSVFTKSIAGQNTPHPPLPKKRFSILWTKIHTPSLPLFFLNNNNIINKYYYYWIVVWQYYRVCLYRFTFYWTFFPMLCNTVILLYFNKLQRFTFINMVQLRKSCSWIFLYAEIVVILHCESVKRLKTKVKRQRLVVTKQVRSTSVSEPFQVRSLRTPLIPLHRGTWKNKKASSPWFICFTSLLTCCRLLKKQNKTNKNI